jgi:hypothetical protein
MEKEPHFYAESDHEIMTEQRARELAKNLMECIKPNESYVVIVGDELNSAMLSNAPPSSVKAMLVSIADSMKQTSVPENN